MGDDSCIFGGNKCAPIFTPDDKRRNNIRTWVNS